ncbi:DESI1 [Acrasis kona]|uniref:DESI1 n=1 Tax=Acrasis kona TaxID=1008807 RepID=A0AAW2ZC66_9EUKA
MAKHSVSLSVYDLSMGMASRLSRSFTGQQFDGIWHTGIVVFGNEYFFGGGVQTMLAGTTPYGTPVKNEQLGETTKTKAEFEQFIQAQGRTHFRPEQYDLFHNNCNNFTEACSQFLLNKSIPDYVKGLPTQFLNTPMGQTMRPLIDSMMGNTASPIASPNDLGSGGGMNMDMINNMMSNPQIQQMASQFLGGGGGGMPNMDMIRNMMGNMGMNNTPYNAPQQPSQPVVTPVVEFNDDHTTFRYLKANVSQVVNKLKSTLKALPKYNYNDQDDQALDTIETFLKNIENEKTTPSEESLKKLSSYIKVLPEKQAFPALDIYRLLLVSPSVVHHQVSNTNSLLYILKESYLLQWTKLSAATQLMSMRALANLITSTKIDKPEHISNNKGASWLLSNMTGIIEIITLTMTFEMDGLRSCGASVAANLSLLLPKNDTSGLDKKLVDVMVKNLSREKVEEVIHRMVLTIYRCLKNNPSLKEGVKVPMLASAMQKESCKGIVRGIIKMVTSSSS